MSFHELKGRQVVLDTAGPVLYLGTLEEVTAEGLWLTGADVHDTSEGSMTKELYIIEAKRQGICANRQRVFVLRGVVISTSALDDVIEH